MKQTLLSLIFFGIYLAASGQCTAPDALVAMNVTGDSATFAWTETGTATSWEIILVDVTLPAPGPDSEGILSSGTVFTVNNLQCGFFYAAYVRSICPGGEKSPWSDAVTILISDCGTCFPPQDVHVTAQTSNSTTVSCTPLDEPNVEFLVQLSWAPPPTPATPMTASSDTFPFTMPITPCGNLSLWYRSACSEQIMWEGPLALRPMNMNEPLSPIYGCVVNNYVLFNLSDLIPQLPENVQVEIFTSLYGVMNPYTTTALTTNMTVEHLLSQGPMTYYVVVDNPGCDDVYPVQLLAGDTCGGFRLETFVDENANGTKDLGEAFFPEGNFGYTVNGGNPIVGYSNNGTYFINEQNQANSYDFGFGINPAYASQFSSAMTYTDVTADSGVTVLQFPVLATSPFVDAEANITALSNPMPGFTMNQVVTYKNNGSQTIASGTLNYTMPIMMSLTTNASDPVTPTPNGFSVSFADLQPFETRSVSVAYTLPTIPTVQLGQLLTWTATVSAASDTVSANNTATLTQAVVGSYDPNDKMEAHGAQILHSSFTASDYLYYTIRFENTGTAAAHNIRIEDMLDAKLNEETVEMIGSSNHCTLTREGNSLVFNLPNVMLPPSVENTQIGHGYVQFRVKPNAGFAVGDVIPNTASIYFDFNPAIVTEEWTTTFVNQLQNPEFGQQVISVYPNPTNGLVFISTEKGNVKAATARDVSGKIVAHAQFTDSLDLSKAATGMYFIEIETDSGLKLVKKIVKR